MASKFKMMDGQIVKTKEAMKMKIPDIEKALEIIEQLEKRPENDFFVDYLISDTIWSKARIPTSSKTVNLWLGANVMVEYSYTESKTLLQTNLQTAQKNVQTFVLFRSSEIHSARKKNYFF